MSVPAPIVIFGAGGFGREVAVLVRDIEAAHPEPGICSASLMTRYLTVPGSKP